VRDFDDPRQTTPFAAGIHIGGYMTAGRDPGRQVNSKCRLILTLRSAIKIELGSILLPQPSLTRTANDGI